MDNILAVITGLIFGVLCAVPFTLLIAALSGIAPVTVFAFFFGAFSVYGVQIKLEQIEV